MSMRRRRTAGPGKAARRRRQVKAEGSISVSQPDLFLRIPFMREAGITITAENALSVSAVYGCCRLIVDSLASAPVRVYEMQTAGRREILYDDSTAYTLNWGASVELAPDALPSQAIEEALFWSALLWGNGYAEIQRDNRGQFFALWPLEAERVIPRRNELGYYYEVMQPSGGTVAVPPRSIFHLRGPGLFGWIGDSTVFRAAKAIAIGGAAQEYAGSYFANGTVLAGVLSSDKIVTKQQAERAREEWKELHGGGPRKQHGIAALGQGLKFESINHDANESQLVESRKFQVPEIARFFGVPTTLLADNEAWTNLSELYLGFYRNALLPWAERFDAEATRKLFPQRQPWREVQHDLTRLTLGSFKDLVTGLKEAVNNGLKTRNEARAILGDNAIGADGDVLVVSGGVKPLEQALEEPEPQVVEPPMEPGEDGEGEPGMPPNGAGRLEVATALDRFQRRLTARRIDLQKNAPDKVESNLAAERAKHESALIQTCRKGLDLTDAPEAEIQVLKMIDCVAQGEPAHLALERLFP